MSACTTPNEASASTTEAAATWSPSPTRRRPGADQCRGPPSGWRAGPPRPGGGAQPSIDANYLLVAVGISPTPDLAAAVRTQAQAVKDAFAPWRVGYDYYNSEETPAPASGVLPLASYRRLQKIKAAYDPDQAIISAHPVWPTRAGEVAPRPVREIKVPKHWTERSVVPAPQPTPRASPP